jgi:ectoine hydroxylase-related dioxygenase (phytanoyl-CoA dioxygenase family)
MLTSEQIERYRREGALFPIPVLTEMETAKYRSNFEELERRAGGKRKRFDNLQLFFPWAFELAAHPRALDAVGSLIGGELLVDGSLIFFKSARDPAYVSWHQDSLYSNWHLTPSVSAWIALSDSAPDNGCMRVIPGSHRNGVLRHRTSPSERNLLKRGEELEMEVDESRALDLTLRAGEMSLHHCNIIHGSRPNGSDRNRIGFIVRYITHQFQGSDRRVLRVRGQADCPQLNLASAPDEAGAAEAYDAWLAFVEGSRIKAPA